ncbi:hypothetical protein [Pontibacter sp. G13]|uniref:hypothetical protein n=1 Tax=Pontibacter sp. G13 TaxID=3074898 RepID=UPI0028895EE0|nr:hypothetical protein [Pontibacter sp. G13]WNJ17483.1 hypothetical protein RJD25_21760 [Pontibacter sp. G13]
MFKAKLIHQPKRYAEWNQNVKYAAIASFISMYGLLYFGRLIGEWGNFGTAVLVGLGLIGLVATIWNLKSQKVLKKSFQNQKLQLGPNGLLVTDKGGTTLEEISLLDIQEVTAPQHWVISTTDAGTSNHAFTKDQSANTLKFRYQGEEVEFTPYIDADFQQVRFDKVMHNWEQQGVQVHRLKR